MLLCVSLIPESSVMTSFVSPVGVTPGVTASKEISASPTITAHELVPSQEPARDHFSTDVATRRQNPSTGPALLRELRHER